MSIENRQHLRFSLDIPTFRRAETGEQIEILVRQISIGGCLLDWGDFVLRQDDFRLEFVLPNNNRLPLYCKIIYRAVGTSVGVKFEGITRFEQELLADIISANLENEGLPLNVNPFSQPPPKYKKADPEAKKVAKKKVKETAIEEEVSV
jgi:hypothetical protein